MAGALYNRLTVVSPAAWVARDLAGAGVIDVRPSMGLDLPALDGTAFWASWSWALRLRASGVDHPFLSPGPHWLPTVPEKFLHRKVWSGTLDDMPYQGPVHTFYKLAEHKHTGVPAAVYLGRGAFRRTALKAFSTAAVGSLHYIGSEPVEFVREYRCFIAHGEVTAASFYKAALPGIGDGTVEITWDAYESAAAGNYPAGSTAEAAAFAAEVVTSMGDDQPPGYVLDVGMDETGRWSVIEANAAWSSNIYHADPAGVIASILASQEPGHPRWAWAPDELFTNRARPLPGSERTS